MITAYRTLRGGFLREGRRECLKVSAGDAAGKAIRVDPSLVLVGSQLVLWRPDGKESC